MAQQHQPRRRLVVVELADQPREEAADDACEQTADQPRHGQVLAAVGVGLRLRVALAVENAPDEGRDESGAGKGRAQLQADCCRLDARGLRGGAGNGAGGA